MDFAILTTANEMINIPAAIPATLTAPNFLTVALIASKEVTKIPHSAPTATTPFAASSGLREARFFTAADKISTATDIIIMPFAILLSVSIPLPPAII